LDKIKDLTHVNADINHAKVILADTCTMLLHGDEALKRAKETAATLFASSSSSSSRSAGGLGGIPANSEDLPKVTLKGVEESKKGISLVDLLVQLNFESSKSAARRLIAGGGARVNGEQVFFGRAIHSSHPTSLSQLTLLPPQK
jgi:tyrosyl-tRNA synthetase